MVKDFPGIPPVGSLDMTAYNQRNQPLYDLHIHVHTFHVNLTWTLSKGSLQLSNISYLFGEQKIVQH